jgi:hypothetical protein
MIVGKWCRYFAVIAQDHGVLGRPSRTLPISMIDGQYLWLTLISRAE